MEPYNHEWALNSFFDLVYEGKCPDRTLRFKHYERCIIEKINRNQYIIKIERHPHLFGKRTLKERSSAFAMVERTYKFNTWLNKIEYSEEEDIVLDMEIDYELLAEEEVNNWKKDIDFLKAITELKHENDVRKFASDKLKEINLADIYISRYELPNEFIEKLKVAVINEVFYFWRDDRIILPRLLKIFPKGDMKLQKILEAMSKL